MQPNISLVPSLLESVSAISSRLKNFTNSQPCSWAGRVKLFNMSTSDTERDNLLRESDEDSSDPAVIIGADGEEEMVEVGHAGSGSDEEKGSNDEQTEKAVKRKKKKKKKASKAGEDKEAMDIENPEDDRENNIRKCVTQLII